jgi:hypothetical protein
MTKVSVFGQQPTETKELKKIELCYIPRLDRTYYETNHKAEGFDNVQLLVKRLCDTDLYDIILCWDNGAINPVIYLGHWNDGVV